MSQIESSKSREHTFLGVMVKPTKPKIEKTKGSLYERTKVQVYATGNKWAIENFHATHD